MLIAWSTAEVTRYSYYIIKNNSTLKWFRYSLFFVLYPAGIFTGELPLIFYHYKKTENIADIVIMSSYAVLFPYLYLHMIKLRRKNLSRK